MKENSKKRTIFQERLCMLIKSKNYTRVKLANEIGVSTDTINKYMRRGAKIPPLDIVSNIAKLFEVDCGYLLGDCDYKTREIEATSKLLGLSEQAVEGLIHLGIQNKDGIKLLLENHSKAIENLLGTLSILIHEYGNNLCVYNNPIDGRKKLICESDNYYSNIHDFGNLIRKIIETKINYKDYLGINIPPGLLPKKQ